VATCETFQRQLDNDGHDSTTTMATTTNDNSEDPSTTRLPYKDNDDAWTNELVPTGHAATCCGRSFNDLIDLVQR